MIYFLEDGYKEIFLVFWAVCIVSFRGDLLRLYHSHYCTCRAVDVPSGLMVNLALGDFLLFWGGRTKEKAPGIRLSEVLLSSCVHNYGI
jgi:hypothetical protein